MLAGDGEEKRNDDILRVSFLHQKYQEIERSLIKFRLIAPSLLPLTHQLVLRPCVLVVLLINRNIQDVYLIMYLVVNILLLLLQILLVPPSLPLLDISQPVLQSIVLLSYFINYFQQLLDLEGFILRPVLLPMPMYLFPEPVDLALLLVDYPVLHLA